MTGRILKIMSTNSCNIQTLHELLICNPISGILTWKSRPEIGRLDKTWNTRYAGKTAGCLHKDGYITVSINSKTYKVHRVIWAMTYGYWPINDIDHKDGNPSNDRIGNLREATTLENGQNRKINSNNKSGYRGVHWNKPSNKWMAMIKVKGKCIHLGYFDDIQEASQSYLTAKSELHQFQPIPR